MTELAEARASFDGGGPGVFQLHAPPCTAMAWQGAVCGGYMSCHCVLCQLCSLAQTMISAVLLGSCVQQLGRAHLPKGPGLPRSHHAKKLPPAHGETSYLRYTGLTLLCHLYTREGPWCARALLIYSRICVLDSLPSMRDRSMLGQGSC